MKESTPFSFNIDTELNQNEILILGLIASSEMIKSQFNKFLDLDYLNHLHEISGITLERIISQSHMRNWTALGKSSIYTILKRLEEKKLIIGHKEIIEVSDKPPKKINFYSITEDGINLLIKDVNTILSSVTPTIDNFMIAFSFSHLLTNEKLKNCLNKRLKAIKINSQLYQDKFLKSFEFKEKIQDSQSYPLFYRMFQRGQHHIEAEITWLEQMLEELG